MNRTILCLAILLPLLAFASAGTAKLCEKCQDGVYTADTGKCAECDGTTGSGAFKLCKDCSEKLGECEHCRAKLGTDKPQEPAKATQTRPAGVDLDAIAKLLSEKTGGKPEIVTQHQSIGPYIRVDLSNVKKEPFHLYLVFPFPLDDAGKEKLALYRKDISHTFLAVIGADSRCTAVAWAGHEPEVAGTITKALGLKPLWICFSSLKGASVMKERIASFTLTLTYCGDGGKPYDTLQLGLSPPLPKPMPPGHHYVQITAKQAEKIIDHLVAEEWLGPATYCGGIPIAEPAGPCYVLEFGTDRVLNYYMNLGWRLPMFKRLESLRRALDAEAAAAMDRLLERLKDHREELERAARSFEYAHPPKAWGALLQLHRDPKTGACSLKSINCGLRNYSNEEKKLRIAGPRDFIFLELWKYDPAAKQWSLVPGTKNVSGEIAFDHPAVFYNGSTSRPVVNIPLTTGESGLYWAKWIEEGYLAGTLVYSGAPRYGHKLEPLPPKHGMIVVRLPGDDSPERSYIPDPKIHCLSKHTAERAKALKQGIAGVWLGIHYHGEPGTPYCSLILHVQDIKWKLPASTLAARISEAQARKIIDHLGAEGFLASAKFY
ncbi:MAG: B-box zinc finger protein, partial [Planctomycetota bacterium]